MATAKNQRTEVPVSPRRRIIEQTRRPAAWLPAVLVLVVYGTAIVGYLALGHDARDFIRIGRRFVQQSHASAVIQYDPHYAYMADNTGNDGQFCYYLALDPVNARYYMDYPGYRYTRILYPLVARVLTFGQASLVPYTLILVNLLAIAGGTWALAAWLRKRNTSPWLALLYGFFPGLVIVLQRDLTEALAYGLVALAVYLFDFGGRRAAFWSGLAFAGAILSRETAALFAIVYAAALLLQRRDALPAVEGTIVQRLARRFPNWRSAVLLLGTALAPFAAYKLFLIAWMGDSGSRPDLIPRLVPFSGLFELLPWHYHQWVVVIAIIVPAMVLAGMGIWALFRRCGSVEVVVLLANIQIFLVMLAPTSLYLYPGTGRITTGITLAGLLCVPAFDRLTGGKHVWLVVTAAFWLLGIPAVTLAALVLHVPLS